MRSGKRHIIETLELPDQERTRTLREVETYKNLGILESDTIKRAKVTEKQTTTKESIPDGRENVSKVNSAVGILPWQSLL